MFNVYIFSNCVYVCVYVYNDEYERVRILVLLGSTHAMIPNKLYICFFVFQHVWCRAETFDYLFSKYGKIDTSKPLILFL